MFYLEMQFISLFFSFSQRSFAFHVGSKMGKKYITNFKWHMDCSATMISTLLKNKTLLGSGRVSSGPTKKLNF